MKVRSGPVTVQGAPGALLGGGLGEVKMRSWVPSNGILVPLAVTAPPSLAPSRCVTHTGTGTLTASGTRLPTATPGGGFQSSQFSCQRTQAASFTGWQRQPLL